MIHRNCLRIIGGQWRGRKLTFPAQPDLRPTPGRVRETLFNWLQPVIAGARCLDLFAGSGVLGFEALSRGAGQVLMIDNNTKTVVQLKKNLDLLAGGKDAQVVRDDVMNFLQVKQDRKFAIVFLDPPYYRNLIEPCCRLLESGGWLVSGAYIYLEAECNLKMPQLPATWNMLRSKTASQVGYHLARKK